MNSRRNPPRSLQRGPRGNFWAGLILGARILRSEKVDHWMDSEYIPFRDNVD
jgi:hypothetical protein